MCLSCWNCHLWCLTLCIAPSYWQLLVDNLKRHVYKNLNYLVPLGDQSFVAHPLLPPNLHTGSYCSPSIQNVSFQVGQGNKLYYIIFLLKVIWGSIWCLMWYCNIFPHHTIAFTITFKVHLIVLKPFCLKILRNHMKIGKFQLCIWVLQMDTFYLPSCELWNILINPLW